jgi:hypothetical protein
MTANLDERLTQYRVTLDEAIVADLANPRDPADSIVLAGPRRHPHLVLAAAALVAIVGLGAVVTLRHDPATEPLTPVGTMAPAVTLPRPTATESSLPTTTESSIPPAAPAVIDRLAFGDSVMLGAATALVDAGFAVDAAESRQFRDAVEAFARLRDDGRLGDVVVIGVGTNGDISELAAESVMAELADVDHVVVLTIAMADLPYRDANNQLIRSLPEHYPNVTVLDWATEAADCPGDCFYSDNIHLRADGQRFYADLIKSEVNRLVPR